MKKLLLLGSAALALAGAAPAFAQVTGTVDVNGFVDDRCQFTVDNAVINLGEISDADGKLDEAAVDAGTATLNGWCNGSAATIQVEAHALVNSASATTGFSNLVHYTATATAGAVDASDGSSVAGPGGEETLGLFTGDIVVDISDSASSPSNALMVAGDYLGSIVVTLTPNVSFGEEEAPSD